MRKLILGVLLCLPAYSYAVPTLSDQPNKGDFVALHEDKCVAQEVLQLIPAQYRDQMQRATSKYEGAEYKACWMTPDGRQVIVVFEDGGVGQLPVSAFQEPGV